MTGVNSPPLSLVRGLGLLAATAIVIADVIGTGVFLAGLELMVTAVALPSIIEDLADPNSGSAWVELRKASWIINGYLLVYIFVFIPRGTVG